MAQGLTLDSLAAGASPATPPPAPTLTGRGELRTHLVAGRHGSVVVLAAGAGVAFSFTLPAHVCVMQRAFARVKCWKS